jgi:hypothetical protein
MSIIMLGTEDTSKCVQKFSSPLGSSQKLEGMVIRFKQGDSGRVGLNP